MEGNLPTCPIVPDVRGYVPSQCAVDAQALLAGFPCQVSASTKHLKAVLCLGMKSDLLFSGPVCGRVTDGHERWEVQPRQRNLQGI